MAEAIAFPGQGVDPIDLARVLHDHRDDPLVEALAGTLGTDRWDQLDLLDTRVAQPAVYTASVVQAAAADVVAEVAFGHSLGELSALAHTGVVTPAEGLDLVVRRAALGHAAHERRPGRMLVVMRLDAAAVEWVRRSVVATGAGVLELAVVNGPGQFVLSGDVDAATVAMDLIAEAGGVGRALSIGGGYHSPLMAGAVDPFVDVLTSLPLRDPTIPIVSCTSQAVLRTAADVPRALARSLVLPVRWVETLEAVAALGVTGVVDAGPSQTLANLARFAPVLPFRALSPDPR